MHKSQYMNIASQMAMEKLQKPVTVTITMKGGGGLSSLRDFPIIKRVSGGDVVDGDFIGGYTDEMAGVEPDITGVDYTVGGGADILGGQQRGKDQARQEDPDRDYDYDPLTIDEVIRQRDIGIIKGQGEKPGEDYRDYLSTFSPRDLRLRGTGPNWSLDEAVRNLLSGTDKYGRNIHSTDKIKAAMDALEAERLDQRLKEEERPEPERGTYTPKNYSPSGPLTLEAAKGGGLSSIQRMPMVYRQTNGQTSYEDDVAPPDLADLTGAVDPDTIGIPDVYGEFGIGVDDQDRLAVLRGLGQEEGEKIGTVDTAAEAFLGFLPAEPPSTLDALEKLVPDFLARNLPFVRTDKEIEEQARKGLDFTKGEYVTGIYDKDGKFVSAEGLSRLAGYTPETAQTEMKRQGAIAKYSNKVKEIDKIEGLTTEQKNERKEEAARNIMSEVRQTGGIPGVFSTMLGEKFARAAGIIAVGEIDGKGVHIHNDGKITYVSPEDDPTYDASLSVGSLAPEAPGVEKFKKELKKVEEETKPTGVASLVTRESKIPESNPFLDKLLAGLYKDIPEEERLRMTGTLV
jgi:hypothetical protein